ncbi:hypothetical protein CSUI_009632 [Cystoisospora suis]|uniref:Uncharacterized protein n=1 Tax=Cystoisospora suis TaxID=483139 RepID=A0A2C6JG81_9APIC|nr:hypothetical protein CSUI_009632 [Cystoisospora suis]
MCDRTAGERKSLLSSLGEHGILHFTCLGLCFRFLLETVFLYQMLLCEGIEGSRREEHLDASRRV